MESVTASTPAAPAPSSEDRSPMSKHVLTSSTLPPTGYLKVGSVVPWSAPVLTFNEDGAASGHLSQPDAEWITDTLDSFGVSWSPTPWPGPRSTGCGHRWAAEVAGQYICTLPKGHGDDIRHEAQGVKGAVLASPTETLTTEALRPARKRTAPKAVA